MGFAGGRARPEELLRLTLEEYRPLPGVPPPEAPKAAGTGRNALRPNKKNACFSYTKESLAVVMLQRKYNIKIYESEFLYPTGCQAKQGNSTYFFMIE
jgi:hypothetical protein